MAVSEIWNIPGSLAIGERGLGKDSEQAQSAQRDHQADDSHRNVFGHAPEYLLQTWLARRFDHELSFLFLVCYAYRAPLSRREQWLVRGENLPKSGVSGGNPADGD